VTGCLYRFKSPILVVVMRETNGDGVGRIVDASGAASVVNNCFSMLR